MLSFIKPIIDFIYPPGCLVCGISPDREETLPLCPDHLRNLARINEPYCPQCGRKLFAPSAGELLCKNCRSSRRYYDRGRSLFLYTDTIRKMIHRYKYNRKEYLKFSFHELITENDPFFDDERIDLIIPVPLHWRRYWQRGFNQSLGLAHAVSSRLGAPVVTRNLRRVRHTRPQVFIAPEERVSNIRGAFRVLFPDQIKGKTVLLVDDITTTGATMNECSRMIKKAGAERILIFTLAQPT